MVRFANLALVSIPLMLVAPVLEQIVLNQTVLAHTVKVAEDVAATFHAEPNHTPKAGQRSLVWAALTRRGGGLIPLSQCDCQMAVYSSSRRLVARPALRSLNAENYRGAIGADITFPQAGNYEVELSGRAIGSANFRPFRLSYAVTVGQ